MQTADVQAADTQAGLHDAAVHETAVHETAVHETAVHETAVNETAFNKNAFNKTGYKAGRVWGALVNKTRDKAGRVGEPRLSGVRSRATLARAVAVACVLAVLSFVLVQGGGSPSPSAEPTVQAFLLAWESGQYQAAAALTTGNRADVAHVLSDTYSQLDAADLALSMGKISQRGGTASAQFDASVDLGRGGLPWTYQGHFALRRVHSSWKVEWSPAVIVPGLKSGDRLAVLTTVPRRAQVLGATGKSLAQPSPVYVVGVRPGRLKNPGVTAEDLARATGLDGLASQVLGQIRAAPSAHFLELVTLRPASYRRLSSRLGRIPGLIVRQARMRLFDSIAPAISGSVGTETAKILLADGVPYRPGTTVGISGLQEEFQTRLAGTPTTEVVVQDAATGRQVAVLKRWPGSLGNTVKTTIDPATQRAADSVLSSLGESAAIVAIRPGGGQILAVAQHNASGMPAVNPLAGQYRPGQTFTIISTAALLDSGFSASTPTPCNATNSVGNESFLNEPTEPNLGPQPPFSTDFDHACGTAFVGLSLNLTAKELSHAATVFGIQLPWHLLGDPSAFAGSMQPAVGYAELAADSIGSGTVRVSPLDMALAAGVVQSGSWHPPSLVTSPPDPGLTPHAAFGFQVVSRLRSLMRSAVRSGAGKAADVDGSAVYGQVGSAPLGTSQADKGLRASWFVGYYADIAFAVLVFTKSPDVPAAALAGQFVRALRPGS
jgi:cell division protein FtsI/penicillin-binding protein 2